MSTASPLRHGLKLPQLLARLPNNGTNAIVRPVVVPSLTSASASSSSAASTSRTSSASNSSKTPNGPGNKTGSGIVYLVTRTKLKFRPRATKSAVEEAGSDAESSGAGSEGGIAGVQVGELSAHGKAYGVKIRHGKPVLPPSPLAKPAREITSGLKKLWEVVDRETLDAQTKETLRGMEKMLLNEEKRRAEVLAGQAARKASKKGEAAGSGENRSGVEA